MERPVSEMTCLECRDAMTVADLRQLSDVGSSDWQDEQQRGGTAANLAAASLSAQGPGERRRDIPVTPAGRDSIITQVISLVRQNYADSNAAALLSNAIQKTWRDGGYSRFDSAAGLVATLTDDLRRAHRDEHLRLDYFVVARPMRGQAGASRPEDLAARHRIAARRGYGIDRVERLPGNVALLSLRSFEPVSIGGPALQSAMRLMAGADAVILDLRQNGGGYGDMDGELTSYFVEGGTIMSESYDRASGTTERGVVPMRQGGPPFRGTPLYVLTCRRTFSAAEGFTHTMRARGLATVVGDTTRGGANPVQVFQLSPHFALFLPTGRVTDLVTRSNWEGTGIAPDVPAPAASAFEVAYRRALESLLARATMPDVGDELKEALARLNASGDVR